MDLNNNGNVRQILCYGDSLTAGYCNYGSEFSPYARTLSELAGFGVNVNVVGMSGWTTDQMVQYAGHKNNEDAVGEGGDGLLVLLKSVKYDVVFLMAGTNDIGSGVPTVDMIENIEMLVKMVLVSNGSPKVILLGPPATGAELKDEDYKIIRQEVNEQLAKIAAESKGRVFFIDTSPALPNPGVHPEPETEESLLWDSDMLHLSPKGSEKLGTYLYRRLVALGFLSPQASRDS